MDLWAFLLSPGKGTQERDVVGGIDLVTSRFHLGAFTMLKVERLLLRYSSNTGRATSWPFEVLRFLKVVFGGGGGMFRWTSLSGPVKSGSKSRNLLRTIF